MVGRLSHEVRTFPDPTSAGTAVADRLAELAEAARGRGERFSLALSGGRTPEPMLRALAGRGGEPGRWEGWELFWVDERLVPIEDADSNAGLARRLWLEPAGFPRERTHPVETTLPLGAAASAYERLLRGHFGPVPRPTFSTVVLGVGPDGHTASLFPRSAALRATGRRVTTEPQPPLPPPIPRVTLTLEAIAGARHAIFLVCGAEKRPVVARLLSRDSTRPFATDLPAARVSARGSVEWFLDREAAPP